MSQSPPPEKAPRKVPVDYGTTSYSAPDLREKSVSARGGEPQILDRRLYAQLQVFTGAARPDELAERLKASGIESVLYLDVNDPKGVGVLALTEDPALFVGPLRELLSRPPFGDLRHRPELTMIGRTYAAGREPNLAYALLKKPRVTALNPEWPWAVWYPLRRKASFAILPPEKQGRILHEHAQIGIAFGQADYAHDIRLACHGLDASDNEFVIGLVGRELTPLSQCVQEMRKTVQTAKYIKSLGPFFVGRVFWQSPAPA
jgi:chlorite dismutase